MCYRESRQVSFNLLFPYAINVKYSLDLQGRVVYLYRNFSFMEIKAQYSSYDM